MLSVEYTYCRNCSHNSCRFFVVLVHVCVLFCACMVMWFGHVILSPLCLILQVDSRQQIAWWVDNFFVLSTELFALNTCFCIPPSLLNTYIDRGDLSMILSSIFLKTRLVLKELSSLYQHFKINWHFTHRIRDDFPVIHYCW